MRLLTVLFVVLVGLVLMIAVVAGISYGLGWFFYSRQSVTARPEDTDPCAQCNADREWYDALPLWEKTVILVWWLVNRYTWAAKGCK